MAAMIEETVTRVFVCDLCKSREDASGGFLPAYREFLRREIQQGEGGGTSKFDLCARCSGDLNVWLTEQKKVRR